MSERIAARLGIEAQAVRTFADGNARDQVAIANTREIVGDWKFW